MSSVWCARLEAVDPSPSPSTLTQVLDGWARDQGERIAFTFLRDGETESSTLSFSLLRQRAIASAACLASLGATGDRAILLYGQGLDFITAFFACLYAGVVAVPARPPNRKTDVEGLGRIAADSGAKWILSTKALLDQLDGDLAADPNLGRLARLDPERAKSASATWPLPPVDPGSIALLQYTSGSTRLPRGVALTHANLVDNQRQMQRSFENDESTVLVSWLPMFHDMGLGTVLMTAWAGAHCVLMSPGSFVQSPRRWLQAISTYGATTSLAPDFAYDLCVRRVARAQRAGLSLGTWRVAVNGSEPVRASTLARFAEAYAPFGFRPEAFQPGYGLAEATLFVTSGSPTEAPLVRHFSIEALERGQVRAAGSPAGQPLVSCGRPWLGTRIAIVDPTTRDVCDADRVGEIWVQGASVAVGYWRDGTNSEPVFRATSADGAGPFLRTGDLGFVSDGELFVTGRHKDLIIIRGRNHYPQDIEDSVSVCHPALVPNGAAAFSIDSDRGEALVIVQEVVRTALRTLDTGAVVRSIRAAVSDHHALQTHAVVLLKPSALPRTASGKVRRKACRQAFLDRSLPAVASWTAPVPSEPDADAAPDTERRAATARTAGLIDWLRHHGADLISSSASDGRRTVPPPMVRGLARHGLLGMHVEPQYGGLGLGHSEVALVLEELAAVDFSLALFFGLNNYLGIQPLARHGGAEIKALLLPRLAQGHDLAAFALDEPGSPKRTEELTAQARPEGEDHFRVFGAKYLDGAAESSVIHVFARHEEPPGVSAFVVCDEIEGLQRLRSGLSIAAFGFNRETIVLDGVRVGRENLLGSLGSGLEIAAEALNHTQLAIAAACVGGMKRLGAVTARVTALECLVHRTASAIDAKLGIPSEAFAACRILGPELLSRSIDDRMQLGISGGHVETSRVLALSRDAGLLRNFDGPPEAVAERTGSLFMESDASLRMLVQEVFCAPDLARWIAVAVEAVRQRMTRLSGPSARRAQRWSHTRAGELAAWLALLAAVEGSLRATPSPELERARGWAQANFEQMLASVRFGTPSEIATLDASDIAATLAPYTRASGHADRDAATAEPEPAEARSQDNEARRTRGKNGASELHVRPSTTATDAGELRSWVMSWLSRHLRIPISKIESGRSFADYGLDSVASVELAKALSDALGRELDETLLWNFATIESLVEYLVSPASESAENPAAETTAWVPPSSTHLAAARLDDELDRLERELKSRS